MTRATFHIPEPKLDGIDFVLTQKERALREAREENVALRRVLQAVAA